MKARTFAEAKSKNLTVSERNYSLDMGFAWIIFEDEENIYNLQACLKEQERCKNKDIRDDLVREDKPIYKKEIDKNDNGMDWGLCEDANSKAFKNFGIIFCEKFLYNELRKIGIKIS